MQSLSRSRRQSSRPCLGRLLYTAPHSGRCLDTDMNRISPVICQCPKRERKPPHNIRGWIGILIERNLIIFPSFFSAYPKACFSDSEWYSVKHHTALQLPAPSFPDRTVFPTEPIPLLKDYVRQPPVSPACQT